MRCHRTPVKREPEEEEAEGGARGLARVCGPCVTDPTLPLAAPVSACKPAPAPALCTPPRAPRPSPLTTPDGEPSLIFMIIFIITIINYHHHYHHHYYYRHHHYHYHHHHHHHYYYRHHHYYHHHHHHHHHYRHHHYYHHHHHHYNNQHHKSITGHGPLQLLAISLDLRLIASSSCQPLYTNRHFTRPEGVLHYVYRDAISTPNPVMDCHQR
jgi:hypothetical protein